MPTTIHIKKNLLPLDWQERVSADPDEMLEVTIRTERELEKDGDVTAEIIEALHEVAAHKKGKITLPTYDEMMKELEAETKPTSKNET